MADATRSLKIVVEEEKKGDGFNQVAKDMDGVSRSVEHGEERLRLWQKQSAGLRTEIEKSTQRVKELRTEVAKTGDVSLFGDIRKEEARLRNFQKTLDAIAADFAAAGTKAGQEFTGNLSSAFQGAAGTPGVGPVLIGALVAGAVAAAPAVGAALAGVVATAVGGIGIAGGIFAASRDPKVKAAAAGFGKELSAQFFGSGGSFVNPTIDALNILSHRFGELNLSSTFAKAAPFVTEFADGIGKLAVNFMPGFNKALDDAAPVINELSKDLPVLGTALGNMFDDIASSKGATDGLAATFGLLEGAVVATGRAVHDLGNIFEAEVDSVRGWGIIIDDVKTAIGIGGLKGAISQTGEGLGSFALGMASVITPTTLAAAATRAMTLELQNLDKATRDHFQLANSLADAELADAAAFLALNEGLVKGAKNWDENTRAGNNNLTLQQQAIEAAQRKRDADIDAANGSAAAIATANAAYQKEIDKILDVGKKAGESKAQLDALAKTYHVDVHATTNVFSVVSSINKALSAFGGGGGGSQSFGSVPGFASGGTPPPGLAWVGERGPELVNFAGRERVYNRSQSLAMAGSGGGGGTQNVTISFARTGDALGDAIIELLRVKRQGGIDF